MPPLSVGDKVIVQNQTGRAPNKWDKSGVIVECKPHNQVNVMMDGSRKVSLRNRQFVRKIEAPVANVSSGVKPSQFYESEHLDEPAVQGNQGKDAAVVTNGDNGQLTEYSEGIDVASNGGGVVIDDQVNHQDRVEIEDRGVADQQPESRSKRNRKPNSKYDPAIYDLDSVEIRGIPLSGKKNGWKGIYWPQ